jgi:hypothetical protein
VGDDVLAIRALEVEMPEDAELGWVSAHRHGEHVDHLAERPGQMDHRAIDAGRSHRALSTEYVGIWQWCALILPFCQRWIWESTISMAVLPLERVV